MKVAAYTRVSTDEQALTGFSLEAQSDRLHSYCASQGWEIYKEYVDPGHSGRNIGRPAYREMMAEMENWDAILVLKMDRIHRNSRNFMEMMDVLRDHNKDFISATEAFNTTDAMGRFVVDIIQRIAQLESEQIGERVFIGMDKKAEKGYHQAQPVRGYDLVDGELIINSEEARLVKDTFKLYISQKSDRKVHEIIRAEAGNYPKYKTNPSGKKRLLIPKNPAVVANTLTNHIYIGKIRWNGRVIDGEHEAIIDERTWRKVQRIREGNLKRSPGLLAQSKVSSSYRWKDETGKMKPMRKRALATPEAVQKLAAKGKSNEEIAEKLQMSKRTVTRYKGAKA